jgi:cadmium resistance protein CadD (predicted permease)
MVAAVKFSNDGDNIGVYIPLFSKYNAVSQITAFAAVFTAMTAVWCIASYYFVNHPLGGNTPHWECRIAFCPHWTWNIHSDRFFFF